MLGLHWSQPSLLIKHHFKIKFMAQFGFNYTSELWWGLLNLVRQTLIEESQKFKHLGVFQDLNQKCLLLIQCKLPSFDIAIFLILILLFFFVIIFRRYFRLGWTSDNTLVKKIWIFGILFCSYSIRQTIDFKNCWIRLPLRISCWTRLPKRWILFWLSLWVENNTVSRR